MKKFLAACVAAVTLVGCAHGADVRASADAGFSPESMRLWSRPQEFGYKLGDRIQGEASVQCILAFICWGSEGGGIGAIVGQMSGVVSGLLGGDAANTDPLVQAAAANAVFKAPSEVDGIYVLNHEGDSFNIGVYSSRKVKVVGKAMTLESRGEVSRERADKERFLRALSGSQVHVPSSAAD